MDLHTEIMKFLNWFNKESGKPKHDIHVSSVVQYLQHRRAKMKMLPDIDISQLRNMRSACEMTLRNVEAITGISNAYLSQLETGKIENPSYEVVKKLWNLYNVNL